MLCGVNPRFRELSPCYRQVAYALLTRAPVSRANPIPLDLHVLGLSLAFILSQDQTLRCYKSFCVLWARPRGCPAHSSPIFLRNLRLVILGTSQCFQRTFSFGCPLSESGCKGKDLFLFSKLLMNFFFKLLPITRTKTTLPISPLPGAFPLKAGAKKSGLFRFSKRFRKKIPIRNH